MFCNKKNSSISYFEHIEIQDNIKTVVTNHEKYTLWYVYLNYLQRSSTNKAESNYQLTIYILPSISNIILAT